MCNFINFSKHIFFSIYTKMNYNEKNRYGNYVKLHKNNI